jgi:hypothetical protein
MTESGRAPPDVKQIVKRTGLLLGRLIPRPTGSRSHLPPSRTGARSTSTLDVRSAARNLAEHHRVLSLDGAVAELAGSTVGRAPSAPAPRRRRRLAVVITFDDGTADFTDVVVPRSTATGCPPRCSSPPLRRRQTDFRGCAPNIVVGPARFAASSNVTIGSHPRTGTPTASTPRSPRLDRSIRLIGGTPRRRRPASTPRRCPARRRPRPSGNGSPTSLAASRVNRRPPTATGSGGHRSNAATASTFTLKADGGLRLEGGCGHSPPVPATGAPTGDTSIGDVRVTRSDRSRPHHHHGHEPRLVARPTTAGRRRRGYEVIGMSAAGPTSPASPRHGHRHIDVRLTHRTTRPDSGRSAAHSGAPLLRPDIVHTHTQAGASSVASPRVSAYPNRREHSMVCGRSK